MDEEIAAFLQLPGPIVLTTFPESEFSKAVWYNRIAGIAPAIEAGGMEALRQGSPSLELLARIKNAVGYWKRNTRIRIAAGAGITVFLIAAAGAGIASLIASQQVEKAGLAFAAAKQATEKADEEATRADAAREAEKEATERAASASAARDQAVEQAAAATAVADQQRTIARRLSAENLVSAAVLRAPEDPAASVRLAEAATEVDPGQNVRNLLFYALRHSPAWNRFPAFPDESFRGELIPRSDREGLTFATDPQIRVVAFKDVKDPRTLVVNDVDTGRTLRRLKIDLAEEVADIQPYARQVLVLRRQVADKQLIRAYEFDALVSDSTDVQPTFRTVAVAIDCADGGWPCALLNTDRHLLLLTKTGSGLEAVNLGAYPGADRVAIHPTGMAVAMFDRLGGITWIARGERWGSGATRKLSFGAGRWQRYGDRIPPLPWLRWGLCPNISL